MKRYIKFIQVNKKPIFLLNIKFFEENHAPEPHAMPGLKRLRELPRPTPTSFEVQSWERGRSSLL